MSYKTGFFFNDPMEIDTNQGGFDGPPNIKKSHRGFKRNAPRTNVVQEGEVDSDGDVQMRDEAPVARKLF